MKNCARFCVFLGLCALPGCSNEHGSESAANGGFTATGGAAAIGGSSSAPQAGAVSSAGMNAGGSPTSAGGAATGGANNEAGAGTNSAGANSAGASAALPGCKTSAPGVTDCGADHDNCCESLKVSGGSFFRTYSNAGSGAQNTAAPATVSDFLLDKYLVTVGRFRQFVAQWRSSAGYFPAAGSGKHSHLNGGQGLTDSGKSGAHESGWLVADNSNVELTDTNLACDASYAAWTATPGDHENLPMNCVNWWEAYAFCIWDGGFLPSEAEYTYAAAGGAEQRRYPWGAKDPGADSQLAICNCNYPNNPGVCSGVANLAPVGTAKLGAGRWGQLDLVGELTEWNLDWFAPAYVSPCTDCANVGDGSGRVIRDGYYSSADSSLLVSYRNSLYPTNRFPSFGFRCARSL